MSVGHAAVEILVEGQVQGVGYRDYARRRASGLGLAGYVMNLKDGRVRVHAEGDPEKVEALKGQLEEGSPLSYVERVTTRWLRPTRRFASFDVRYAEFEP